MAYPTISPRPEVVPEQQSGLQPNRTTTDMIFSLRQLQEKCTEQNQPLYLVFVDFTKVFDTGGRQRLWKLQKKHGCSTKFTGMTNSLRMKAIVTDDRCISEPFKVTDSIKQGCVLTLSSIVLSPIILECAFKGMNDGVYRSQTSAMWHT